MTKTTKLLLGLSIAGVAMGVAFISGLVNVHNPAFYVALPGGAICFGLFLISKMLEKETALYDQDQRAALSKVAQVSGRRYEQIEKPDFKARERQRQESMAA
jgi:hypothetical protein